MGPVHESGPWTRSKVGVHGPLVHVLSSPEKIGLNCLRGNYQQNIIQLTLLLGKKLLQLYFPSNRNYFKVYLSRKDSLNRWYYWHYWR